MIQPWNTRISPLINHLAAEKVFLWYFEDFLFIELFFFTHSAKFGDNIKFAMHG